MHYGVTNQTVNSQNKCNTEIHVGGHNYIPHTYKELSVCLSVGLFEKT